ncbi:GDSL-type esterase/lipase family protein [Halalkalibacter alkalisediminis]|uniref:GDSL-type esterase/lipase family protein n=1 Tax=Halalkalibacter alkalisediminis TaxID=935616 RepID=A0ABV6NIZ2_9BACI|nr:GDSL-type esterase/lipase family protein [Halalkalibacter alkalisediminis]
MVKLLKSLLILLIFSLVFSTVAYAKSDQAKQHLLGLGDSIPYGYNLGEDNEEPSKFGFPNVMGEEANLRVRNLSIPGWRSDQMLHALRSEQKFRQAVRHADYITLTIGNNDLLQALARAELESNGNFSEFLLKLNFAVETSPIYDNISNITKEIRSLTEAPIVIYNVYNPFHHYHPLHGLAHTSILPGVNAKILETQYQLNEEFENVLLANAFEAIGTNQAEYILVGDIHPTVAGQEKLAVIGLASLGLR